jgi:hypothetical protein
MKSLWAVPDVSAKWPGTRTPITVAVVVGLITYFIVFNLELIMWLNHTI